MSKVKYFPESVKKRVSRQDLETLPKDVSILEEGETVVYVAQEYVTLSFSETSVQNSNFTFSHRGFKVLLDTLTEYEACHFRLSFFQETRELTLDMGITAAAGDLQAVLLRRSSLSSALRLSLKSVFPGVSLATGEARRTWQEKYATPIISEGYRFPLQIKSEDRGELSPVRLVGGSQAHLEPEEAIIFPSFPQDIDSLPLLVEILETFGGNCELHITIRPERLNAPRLRSLHLAQNQLRGKTIADLLKNAGSLYKETGADSYLTALLTQGKGFLVEVVLSTTASPNDVLLSLASQALFGGQQEKSTYPARLDLRGFYPRQSFHEKILPVFLALGLVTAQKEMERVRLPETGILLGRTLDSEEVRLVERDRARHLYLIGATGTGKSTLFANMIKQDIEQGRGVILFDPHGDLWHEIKTCVPRERQKDLVLAHLGDKRYAFTMNILSGLGGDPAWERNTITNTLIELFKRVLYPNVPEAFGPIFESYFRNALMLLMVVRGNEATIMDFERIFDESSLDPRDVTWVPPHLIQPLSPDGKGGWKDDDEMGDLLGNLLGVGRTSSRGRLTFRKLLLKLCDDERIKRFWRMAEAVSYNEITIESVAPYIVSKLTQITGSPLLAPILGATESSLDFQDILNEGKICLINLAKGEVGSKDAAFAGGLLSIRLAMAAQARARLPENQRRAVTVYMDEFQTYATEMLSDMMSEVRKFGLRMVLANQTLSQIDGRGFRVDTSGGILGNVANLVVFRVGVPDAEILARWFVPHFSVEELTQLPDYHAAVRLLANGKPLPPMIFATLPPLKKAA